MTRSAISTTLRPASAGNVAANSHPPRHAGDPAHEPAPEVMPRASEHDITGIGDIVLAGQPTGYIHLRSRGIPTAGRFATAARKAAAALARPALWPRPRGRWQRAPRAARRVARGRMRITVVALEPNDAVALPPLGARTPSFSTNILHVAHGRVHTVVSAPDGEMRAVQELGRGRSRVLADVGRHRLVNTGTGTAVVVRVTGP